MEMMMMLRLASDATGVRVLGGCIDYRRKCRSEISLECLGRSVLTG